MVTFGCCAVKPCRTAVHHRAWFPMRLFQCMTFNVTFPDAAEERVVAAVGAMRIAAAMTTLMSAINCSRQRTGNIECLLLVAGLSEVRTPCLQYHNNAAPVYRRTLHSLAGLSRQF